MPPNTMRESEVSHTAVCPCRGLGGTCTAAMLMQKIENNIFFDAFQLMMKQSVTSLVCPDYYVLGVAIRWFGAVCTPSSQHNSAHLSTARLLLNAMQISVFPPLHMVLHSTSLHLTVLMCKVYPPQLP